LNFFTGGQFTISTQLIKSNKIGDMRSRLRVSGHSGVPVHSYYGCIQPSRSVRKQGHDKRGGIQMSSIVCGRIHQGHERFILVITPQDDRRFLCVCTNWLIYCVSKFCVFANGGANILIKSFFMQIIFFSVHPTVVNF